MFDDYTKYTSIVYQKIWSVGIYYLFNTDVILQIETSIESVYHAWGQQTGRELDTLVGTQHRMWPDVTEYRYCVMYYL